MSHSDLGRRIIEIGNVLDPDSRAALQREVFAEDYVLHPCNDPEVVGLDAYIERASPRNSFFDAMQFHLDDVIETPDGFVMRYHWTAEYKGQPIGNKAIEINRVAGGLVVETWNAQDRHTVLTQIAAIDEPTPTRDLVDRQARERVARMHPKDSWRESMDEAQFEAWVDAYFVASVSAHERADLDEAESLFRSDLVVRSYRALGSGHYKGREAWRNHYRGLVRAFPRMILDRREISGRVVLHHVTFASDDGDEMRMIMLHPFEGGVATEVVFFDDSQEDEARHELNRLAAQ